MLKIAKKLFSMIMIILVISIPFIVADAYAMTFEPINSDSNVKVKIYDQKNEAQGYAESGETLIVETRVKSSSDVIPSQIRFNDMVGFSECLLEGIDEYVCKYFYEDYDSSSIEFFSVYAMDVVPGAYNVPDTCSDTKCMSGGECNDCLDSIMVSPDTVRPEVSSMSFGSSQEGILMHYEASDLEGSGLRKIEVALSNGGTVLDTEFILPDSTGKYPELKEGTVGPFAISEGTYDFSVTFYDALGNSRTKTKNSIEIDTTPPQIRDYHILLGENGCPTHYTIEEVRSKSLNAFGTMRMKACIYLELTGSDTEVDSATVSLKGLDQDNPQKEMLADSIYCNSDYCLFDGYADKTDMELYLREPGHVSITGDFSVQDTFGNSATQGLSRSLKRVDRGPTMVGLKLDSLDNPNNYIGEYAKFVFEFDSEYPIDKDSILLDCGGLRPRCDDIPADYCDQTRCEWEIDIEGNSMDATEALIRVDSPRDQFGNFFYGSESAMDLNVIVDLRYPELNYIKLTNVEDTNSLWENTCEDRSISDEDDPAYDLDNNAFCSYCKYDSPRDLKSANIHCDDNGGFWKEFSDTGVFQEDDYMDVEITFSDTVAARKAYLNVSSVTGSDLLLEGNCDSESETITCNWDSVGRLRKNPNIRHFDVLIEDSASNVAAYQIPFITYGTNLMERNFWDVSLAAVSPSDGPSSVEGIVDTHLLSLFPVSLFTVTDLASVGGSSAEVAYVSADCDALGNAPNIIDDVSATWSESKIYLDIQFDELEVSDDEASYNCTLEIKTVLGADIYGPESDSFVVDVNFINAPYGSLDEGIQDKIDAVKELWGGDLGLLVGTLKDIFDFVQNICNLANGITSVTSIIIGVCDAIKDIWSGTDLMALGLFSAVKTVQNAITPWSTLICGILTCGFCSAAISNPSALMKDGGDGKMILSSEASSQATSLETKLNDAQGTGDPNDPYTKVDPTGFMACFESVYSGDGYLGAGEGFDLVDLCALAAPLICVFELNGIAQLLNNPMSATMFGGKFGDTIGSINSVMPPGTRPVSLDKYNSLILSTVTLCVPGVIHNVNKMRQIDCTYAKCLQDEIIAGTSTVSQCEQSRSYAACEFVIGEVWSIIPFNGLAEQIGTIVEGLLTDPMTYVEYLGGNLICAVPCGSKGVPAACTACEGALSLFNLVGQILQMVTDFVGLFGEDGEFNWDSIWPEVVDNCDGVLDEEAV